MWSLSYTCDLRQLGIAPVPTDFRLEVRCTEINERRGLPSQARMAFSIHRGATLVAHGAAHYTVITPSVYARLRADRLDPHPFNAAASRPAAPPLAPALVGRTSPADVVLTPTEEPGRWLLTPDFNHPILFDHHADHLPGMVLLEAARQAATAAVAPGDPHARERLHRLLPLRRTRPALLDRGHAHLPGERHHHDHRGDGPPGRRNRLHVHHHRTGRLTAAPPPAPGAPRHGPRTAPAFPRTPPRQPLQRTATRRPARDTDTGAERAGVRTPQEKPKNATRPPARPRHPPRAPRPTATRTRRPSAKPPHTAGAPPTQVTGPARGCGARGTPRAR
ncbi:AfsA-related hotdog domain-containing protein [Streptomyces sp. NPDC001982]|uniref:AfsA-related hotdog domain-containing protein n=1 Tax=Streptomyces sp. NPDC001982 TaxID=3154405 RepID=UPI003316C1FE